MTQAWELERMALLAPEGFRSKTVTAIVHDRRLDVAALIAHLASRDMAIASGYGVLREMTFRIGHMGEIQPADVELLLAGIDDYLASRRARPGTWQTEASVGFRGSDTFKTWMRSHSAT